MLDSNKLIRWLVGGCGLLAVVGFIALGNWQLERRLWKLALMQTVDERIHAAAEPAPNFNPSALNSDDHNYRRVFVQGRFLEHNTLVVAATELGSGYWVMTPLQRHDNSIVWINRGFIGQGITPPQAPAGDLTVTGLLRLNEPGGNAVRDNNPATGRWYSRDVVAIAAANGLSAAPYFIDAAKGEPGSAGNGEPVGGLTVIRFHNNHLVYALTWYGLALMVIGAAIIVVREERRPQQPR